MLFRDVNRRFVEFSSFFLFLCNRLTSFQPDEILTRSIFVKVSWFSRAFYLFENNCEKEAIIDKISGIGD